MATVVDGRLGSVPYLPCLIHHISWMVIMSALDYATFHARNLKSWSFKRSYWQSSKEEGLVQNFLIFSLAKPESVGCFEYTFI